MKNLSPEINIITEAMRRVSDKVFRDFTELENLQPSHKTAEKFADKTVERVSGELLSYIGSKARDYDIIFMDGNTKKEKESPFRILINPICGRNNLAHSVPYFCVVVTVQARNSDGVFETKGGVIESVMTQETLFSAKGKGAFVNARRLRVSSRGLVDRPIIALGVPPKDMVVVPDFMRRLGMGLRIGSCPAMDLAYVAAGKYDACLLYDRNEFNTDFGLMMAVEAGGSVGEVEVDGEKVTIVSNSLMFDDIKKAIQK